MSISKAFVSGNLVRDAEQHGGMCAFTVAINERERGEDGQWRDGEPSYIECKILGARAGKLVGYLTKGKKVAVLGRLRQERWQNKDGVNQSMLRVIVDDLEFMSAGEQRQQRPEPRESAYADEEIPF